SGSNSSLRWNVSIIAAELRHFETIRMPTLSIGFAPACRAPWFKMARTAYAPATGPSIDPIWGVRPGGSSTVARCRLSLLLAGSRSTTAADATEVDGARLVAYLPLRDSSAARAYGRA